MLYRETSAGVFASWAGEPIDEVRHSLLIEQNWSDEELAAIGLHRPAPADPVPAGKRVADTTVARVDGIVRFVHQLEDIPLAERRSEKLAALAERRWQAETGGMVFGGAFVRTDRETSAILTAAYVKAMQDPDYVVPNWKVAEGMFMTLDAATIVALAEALRAHVQAAFDNEAALSAALLAAETVEALDAVDLDAGW